MRFIERNLAELYIVKDGTHDSPKYVNPDIGYPLVTSKNLKAGFIDLTEVDFISNEDYEKINKRSKVGKGDLLFAMIGTIGNPVVILTEPNYAIKNVALFKKNEDNNSIEYLKHLLSSEYIKKRLIKDTTGGTQKFISLGKLRKFNISIPEIISDQLHIANILSQAENLIVKRKESILLLDEFLKSTFLEMFGDPVGNEKGWEINSLGKFGSLKNGLNYTRNEKGVSVRCLGVGNFKDLSKLTDIESLTILNLSSVPSIDYFLKDGDLVFVRSNGNRELVGRCILVFPKAERVTFSGFCIRYRIEKAGIDSIFLSHLFRVPIFKKSMLQSGRGANIQNINQQILEGLKIPIPPLALQTKFAQIVESTEVIKAQYQSSLQELESLYGSLSQRAFKGELRAKDGEMLMAAEEATGYRSEEVK